MRTPYPHHLKAFSYVGPHRYSLTFCTHERQKHFTKPDAVDLVTTHILRTAMETGFAIIAYCFMPDHVHLVVEGLTERADLKRFAHRAKQFSGYERVLRDEEGTQHVVRYVLENPVRAGLAKHPREYAFLGSSLYSLEELLRFAYETNTTASDKQDAAV